MNQTEVVWYEAKCLDNGFRAILDGDYFKHCDSVEATRQALDRHMAEFGKKRQYIICRTTYRTVHDENGLFVRSEDICEAIEIYPMTDYRSEV